MTDTRQHQLKRAALIGAGLLFVSLAAAIGLYFFFLKHPVRSECRVGGTIPSQLILGQRYPIEIHATLPWHLKPDAVAIAVKGGLMIVDRHHAISSIGFGYTTWLMTVQVMSVTSGEITGVLTVADASDQCITTLGPSTVRGLLKEGENFTPELATYSPTDTGRFPLELVGSIGFACLALCLFAWGSLNKRRTASAPNPGDALAQGLMALENETLEDYQVIHQQVSDMVRAYISIAWNIPLSTRTTDEFLEELESITTIPRDVRDCMREYLIKSDLVKYSRERNGDAIYQHFSMAKKLLESSEAQREEMPDGS